MTLPAIARSIGVHFALPAVGLVLALPAAADRIDDYVRRAMQEQRIPGLAVLIVRDGKAAKLQGYGQANVEHRVPVTADTVFQSGSVGKQFTAAAVLMLAESGKLALDDPLALHFSAAPSAWHRITVRQLLAHTSGMKDYGDEFDYRRDYTEAELLAVAMRLPIEFEPGTQWSYSNTGYMVLGVLVSRLSGEHWSEFVRRRIFDPAGMTTARVITEADIVPHRAAGYERSADGALRNQEWVAPSFNTQGDGALYFSIRDLAAWDRALRDRELLNRVSYEAWWTPVELGSKRTYPYGFGWYVSDQRGRRVVEHSGSWQGFQSFFARYLDDDLSVAVLANVSDADTGIIAREVAGLADRDLVLPPVDGSRTRVPELLTNKLRAVLEAWATWRQSDHMGEALAASNSGSAREAYDRRKVGERLGSATQFDWLAEDDVAGHGLKRRGGDVARIVYYLLAMDDATYRYRFYLSADDRVLDFGEI